MSRTYRVGEVQAFPIRFCQLSFDSPIPTADSWDLDALVHCEILSGLNLHFHVLSAYRFSLPLLPVLAYYT